MSPPLSPPSQRCGRFGNRATTAPDIRSAQKTLVFREYHFPPALENTQNFGTNCAKITQWWLVMEMKSQ